MSRTGPRQGEQNPPTPEDPQQCRAYDVDGEPVRVRGGRELDELERGYLAEIVRAARRRMGAGPDGIA